MKRALLALLGLVLALVVAAALVLASAGPRLVERAIAWGGRTLGYQELHATVRAVGPRSLEIARLSAGPAPGFTLEDVSLRFALRTLLAGRVDAVSVRSAVLHGEWSEAGILFPSLPPGEEEGPLLAPPAFARLELGHARVVLAAPEGPLVATFTDTELDAAPGARLHARTNATVERAAGPLTAEADLFLDGQRASGLVTVRDEKGSLDLRLDLGEPGPAPGRFPELASLDGLVAAGRLALRAEGADLSPLLPALTASADAGFELAEGSLRVRGEQLEAFGVRVAGLETEIALAQARVGALTVASLELDGRWDEEGISFPEIEQALAAVPSEDAAGEAAAEGEPAAAPLLPPLPFERLALGRARIALSGSRGPLAVTFTGTELAAPPGARLHARTNATVERAAGPLTAEADLFLDGPRASGLVTVRDEKGALDLRLDLGEPGPAPGRFPELASLAALSATGRLALRAERADLSPLVPRLTAAADVGFELDSGLLEVRAKQLEAFGVRVAGVESAVDLAEPRPPSVKAASVDLEGTWDEEGFSFPALEEALASLPGTDGAGEPARAQAAAEAGPLLAPLPFERLELGRARVAFSGSRGPLAVVLGDARVEAPAGARLRARSRLDVEREPGALAGEIDFALDGPRLSGHADLRSADGSFSVRVDLGKHGPAPGRAPQLASLAALVLAGSVSLTAEEADLSPWVEELTARGTLDLRVAKGHLRVQGEGIRLASGGFEVGGLGLSVELAGLEPPSAPLGQQVSIASVSAGLDLGGGSVRFGLDPDGVIRIEPLDWQFHGGRLSSVGRLDPSADHNEIVVRVTDVDLASLVAAIGRPDLAATGRVSGNLPLRLEGDRIFADGGRLIASEEGGVIRYGTPPAPGLEEEPGPAPQGGLDLVLDALENFQYRRLEIGMDGELTGELALSILLEGANPAVYDGYPFQVNLNLEGPLADVVKGSTIGFQVQDAVEKRLQKREERR